MTIRAVLYRYKKGYQRKDTNCHEKRDKKTAPEVPEARFLNIGGFPWARFRSGHRFSCSGLILAQVSIQFGSVHLSPSWTLPDVSTKLIISIYTLSVQTAMARRL